MLRLIPFALSALALLSIPERSAAQTSWSDYQRALQDSRRQSYDQYQQWQRDRLDRYRQHRAGRVPGRSGYALDLPGSDIPAGSYNIQLPGGLDFLVNVGERDGRAGAWVDGNYVDLASLADQLHERVRDLQIVLTQHGQLEPWKADVLYAREALSALTKALEDQEDPRRVRELFERFDELWHPLAHDLTVRFGQGSAVGQHVAAVTQLDNDFHQVLRISPAPIYDTVQFAALTWQLSETTRRLQREIDEQARVNPVVGRLSRQADRVYRHARDLHEIASRGEAYSVVQDEFIQFDSAWHRLATHARSLPIRDRELRRLGRDVWRIDQSLHEELLIDAPLGSPDQRTANLAKLVARTAEYLAYELEWELGRGYHEAVNAAESLAQAARNVHSQMADGWRSGGARREIRLVGEWWDYLDGQLHQLDRRRFRESFEIAERLERQVRRLERSAR